MWSSAGDRTYLCLRSQDRLTLWWGCSCSLNPDQKIACKVYLGDAKVKGCLFLVDALSRCRSIKDKPHPSDALESEEKIDEGCPQLQPGTLDYGTSAISLSWPPLFPRLPRCLEVSIPEDSSEWGGLCHLVGIVVPRGVKAKAIAQVFLAGVL